MLCPSYIRLRSHKYNSTTVSTHITNLFNILHDISKLKSIFMFLTDGGPDFNPAHTIIQLFYFRRFKKLEADILCVMTYAARRSAFNSTEHLWSPCADRLSGVFTSVRRTMLPYLRKIMNLKIAVDQIIA